MFKQVTILRFVGARFLTVGQRNYKYGKGENLNKLSRVGRFMCERLFSYK